MPQPMIDLFRDWYRHEQVATAKVLESLGSVPESNRSGAPYQRALGIVVHLLMARRVWLGRLGAAAPFGDSMFAEGSTLADVETLRSEVEALWGGYLDELSDEDLSRSVEYQSLDAGKFRNALSEILAQLNGHAWYHRGQIAMLVKQAGGEPAITDLIYFCREPIDGSATTTA